MIMSAEVAQVVVVRREDVAAVVPAAFDLGDHVFRLIAFQERIVHVHFHRLDPGDGFGRHPDDGLVHHLFAVGLVELDGRGPLVEQARVRAGAGLLQLGEGGTVLVRKPELTAP